MDGSMFWSNFYI